MHDDDGAVGGRTVPDLDVSGITGDSVERYRGPSKDHSVSKVCRAQKVGCGRGGRHERELRVHCGKRKEERGRGKENRGRDGHTTNG